MKRAILRLVMENYVACLEKRLPASGKPLLHDLVADANVMIGALPTDGGPDVGDLEHLDLGKVKACMEWLFMTIASAHSDSWFARLAAHLLRLSALESAPEVLDRITNPKQTLSNPHETKQEGTVRDGGGS